MIGTAPRATAPRRRFEPEPLLALAFLGSGAPLVVSIVTGISLGLTLTLSAIFAGVVGGMRYSSADPRVRARIRATLVTGIIAGLAATVVYDVARIALVTLGQMRFYPFETFNKFGELLIGFDWPRSINMTVGTAYHFLNGTAFTISYCFLLGGRRWYYGVLWGLGLEVMMFTVYTNWLDLEEVMGEFVTVSLLGHVAWGATFGVISERRLSPERLARVADEAGAPDE